MGKVFSFSAKRFLAVFLAVLGVGVSGCTDESQSEELPEGVVVMWDQPPGRFTLNAPKGWDCRNDEPPIIYKCTRSGKDQKHSASLRVTRLAPHIVATRSDPPKNELHFNIVDDFNLEFTSNQKNPRVSGLKKLPTRLIGGKKAYGKAYNYYGKDRNLRIVEWMIGRPDGQWYINLYSDASFIVPPELLKAVDTVRWVPADPTVKPQNTTSAVPTSGSSEGP